MLFEPLGLVELAPKLFDLLCADSSLLPPLAERPAPGICSGGPTLLFGAPSCGVPWLPIGVARLSFGGAWRGICNGGRGICIGGGMLGIDMGGAAALLTGLWLGEAGIARPSRGILFALCCLLPAIGGRRSGAGDAMSMAARGS